MKRPPRGGLFILSETGWDRRTQLFQQIQQQLLTNDVGTVLLGVIEGGHGGIFAITFGLLFGFDVFYAGKYIQRT
jgi:hypothetical protein